MATLTYLFIISLISFSDAARILGVFPVPSISHQVVFRPLTQELAKRGHEVVVITPDPAFTKDKSHPNLTEIDVHDISYAVWEELVIKAAKGNKDDLAMQMKNILHAFVVIVDAQLKDKEVQKLLRDKSQKFDLVFVESSVRLALIFGHYYKAPVIEISSLGAVEDNYKVMGAPVHPFLYPALTRQRTYNLTLWEKVTEFYKNYYMDQAYENMKLPGQKMLQNHFGNDVPTMDELNNIIDMLFLNIHPIFEGIRPVPPSVIYMGGLHQKIEQPMTDDLKAYLDSSKNGVVYLSFGTNVNPSLLPASRIQTLIQAFSKLPYDVLWKWNQDELPGRSSNIKISKWLPQSALLKHPKVKVFITQGGLQSTDEALTAGVPLIGIPMMVDQWFNVQKYETLGIGVGLDLETLTPDQLINAINKVIDDESYRQNLAKVHKIMQDEPMRPLERAVWWTEYVLRHGGAKHLRSPSANISWTEYLELELVFTLLAAFLAFAAVVVYILYYIYSLFFKKQVNVKSKRA